MVWPLPWMAAVLETTPSSHHLRWDVDSQLCGLWWTQRAQSYVLPAGALYPTLQFPTQQNWVDGAAIPCYNPLHVRHAQRNRAPMLHCSLHQCWTALRPRGKNGRFKNKQISSLFACSHAYCHNKIKNWGTPKYKKKALLLHAKSLLRACRANENDTMTA